MAGNPGDKYTIQILNGSGGSEKKSSTQKAAQKATSYSGEGQKGLIADAIVARELRTLAVNATAYAVSTVGITTGNSVSQQRMQVALGGATKLVAYGTMLATGNVAGAAIMAVHDAVSVMEKANTLRLRNNVEAESLALSRERAGVAFNQSRLGASK